MKNWEIIERALRLVGMEKPNCLFIAADSTHDYLHFAELDYEDVKPFKKELERLGVIYIAKYETLAVEREKLWDNRK